MCPSGIGIMMLGPLAPEIQADLCDDIVRERTRRGRAEERRGESSMCTLADAKWTPSM